MVLSSEGNNWIVLKQHGRGLANLTTILTSPPYCVDKNKNLCQKSFEVLFCRTIKVQMPICVSVCRKYTSSNASQKRPMHALTTDWKLRRTKW